MKLFFKQKDIDIGGYFKAHLYCKDHKQEINLEYMCDSQVMEVTCYNCNSKINFYPDLKLLYGSEQTHKLKSFSRSIKKYSP